MNAWTKADLKALDLLPNPCWVLLTAEVRIWWANEAAILAWGASDLRELASRDLSIMSDAARRRLTDTVTRIERDETIEKQWTFFPGGVPLSLLVRCTALCLDDGRPGMLCVARDLSQALPEDDLRGLQAFRHAVSPVSLFRQDGSPLNLNPAARAVYPEEGLRLADRFAEGEDIHRLLEAVAGGEPFGGEFRVRTAAGSRWHALDAQPVLDPVSGEPAVVINERDVTERVLARQELERSRAQLEGQAATLAKLAGELDGALREAEAMRRRAEAANLAKSQFLAVMSHELRTPMTGILGTVDFLLTTRMTEQQAGWIGELRASAGSLMMLLNDILDFSKIEAGELRLEQVSFDVADVIGDTVRMFSIAAAEKGIELLRSMPPDTPAKVIGDPSRLRQILSNLVANAIKFTDGGSIVVRVAGHELSGSDMVMTFEVEDTGIGMDDKTRSRLFRPFEQGDDSIARRYGGTGLGLAICKRLVEMMGGGIDVVSRLGAGATFRFSVRVVAALGYPAADQLRTIRPTGRAGTGAAPSRRILLAEDNAANRKLIAAMLVHMGHAVEAVADGFAALQRVEEGNFDLVLMDMHMPGMDGVDATRRIRALPGAVRRIPVVALTADAVFENRARYMEAGLTDFATKPVDWDKLRSLIGGLADWRRADATEAPEGHPRAAEAPLCTRTLGKLLDSLGEAVLGRFLNDLPAELRRQSGGVVDAARLGHPEEMRENAHSLSGMAGNFGLLSVRDLARSIERAPAGRVDAADLDRLPPAVEDGIAALSSWRRSFDARRSAKDDHPGR